MKSTFSAWATILLLLYSFSCCCLPDVRNCAKFQSSKVIDLGINRKSMCDFLLVINSNLDVGLPFSRYWRLKPENGLFSPPHHCLTPPSRGTPCTINIICRPTSLKSTFSGLQFCPRHYGSIFIHLAIVAFQNREITRNSDNILSYSSSRSSILVPIESPCICDFLLVINSNFGPIYYRFRNIDA